MNPAWWLLAWLLSVIAASSLTAWLFYGVGYDHGADPPAGRHRSGGPLRIPGPAELAAEHKTAWAAQPDPEWSFFSGAGGWPPPGPAEYALLTRTAGSECETCPDETPSAFTRRMSAEVDEMIRSWEAQGNTDRHLIQARE
jgi:hypothetical protein